MKLIIAGSRGIEHDDAWDEIINIIEDNKDKILPIDEIVSGGAQGVDSTAENYAITFCHPFKKFEAEWDKYGVAAGPIRNKAMAHYGDALIVVWDGKSRGTKNMMDHMHRLKKPVYLKVLSR